MAARAAFFAAVLSFPALLDAQTPPQSGAARPSDSTLRALLPRSPADTDTTKGKRLPPGTIVIPGSDLPIELNLRLETKTERDRNLRCNSLEAAQVSVLSGCGAGFLAPQANFKFALKSAGTIGDQFHVNIDYDMGREFDASNTVSMYYEGKPGAALRRVDVGNITFAPPPSRFMTSSLPAGNYGVQAAWQIGRLQLHSIFAKQTGNVVQSRRFDIGARAEQSTKRDVEDNQIERLRFFFTVDPALFGKAYPNIDILNASQLRSLAAALPDTLRPTRVLLYRLQFGAQPQNPNGPQFRLQSDGPGGARQTYDLLREGVDYFIDPSLLWFSLVRPLNETNERLVVAYNVRLKTAPGRDTVWATTGGTPDLALVTTHDQVANLVMDPSVTPTQPAFRREIRSVYRLGGEDLVRQSTQVRIVTGTGLLEHPLAGSDATFLQMFGLSQRTNPAEFDYESRIWPRRSDPVFNLGAGAADIRNGLTLDAARIVHDYFVVFPSLRPFAHADSGLVTPGNPTNDPIYTIPGEYLNSTQHPVSVYRLHLEYQSTGTENGTSITLGATQMRPGSEGVLLDGRPLVRDLDYRIDYDLGRIDFLRPDTLFTVTRRVDVRYEDNPAFAPTPTTLAGIVSELPVSHGVIAFSAINQTQSTPFNRPQLGFQGNSTLTAGITGQFSWDAPALTRFASHLPFGDTKVPSRFSIQGELASSHPQFLAPNQSQAYIDSFEGAAGFSIALGDIAWYDGSLPAYGHTLRSLPFTPALFETNRAATIVWQSNVQTIGGNRITFTRNSIDPLTAFAGTGLQFNEPVLWLTLLPLDRVGQYRPAKKEYDWTVTNQPTGRRWRSIRTVLNPAGLDLTGAELLQFWTLLDTSVTARAANPTMIFDFGDISENSLSFAPQTLTIQHNANGTVDSIYTGKKVIGFDVLNTERDPFSHAFNADVNDTGLPGDVVDTLTVIDGASVTKKFNVPVCRAALGAVDVVGDPRTNCTVANAHLDEEDIDLDNALNFRGSQRENERLLRYVVDLSDPAKYRRVGGSYTDTILVRGVPVPRTRRWVLVSVPFKSPTDSLNDVNRRRIRALRLTLVSGALQGDEEPTQLPIAELEVTGAPWLDRSSMTLVGVAGAQPDGGFVLTSTIGTNDSSATVVYQPPPGVTNQTDIKGGQFAGGLTEINEHSLRIQAGNMPLYHRAEAFFRFPSGPQDYMAFRRLRVWGRGRGTGWGLSSASDLQMYVKIGRDENNFYLYRTPVNAGQTAAAWSDIAVDLNRFLDLRRKIQADYLAGKKESITCSGADSAIVVASPLPVGVVSHRFAACDNGYMVYTVDPAVSAPNLRAVQEVAVGIIRTNAAGAGSPISPGDTLELWVDDLRLDQQDNAPGAAGQVAVNFNVGGFGDFRMSLSNKDANFRQLGDQPSFLSERNLDIASTWRLEKLLPATLGLSMPLTITKSSLSNAQLFLAQSDIGAQGIAGLRTPRTDVTTYSVSVRRTTPITSGLLGPLLNNVGVTSSYTTGVDRTEYQDGRAHQFNVGVDYLVADDTARTLGGGRFRWNPTQLRVTSGFLNGADRRESFIKPAAAADDQPSVTSALSRLWRSGSVLEFRPTLGLNARWEVESVRDLRNYAADDTSEFAAVVTRERRQLLGANAGFERERTMLTSVSFAPGMSTWFRPRAELGTQFNMLRDPNARSLVSLPGVVGVDSVLAARDSLATTSLTLPRRMTAAQTTNVGTTIDVSKAVTAYTSDSSTARRFGSLFTPVDVSYTRSLLAALDDAPVGAPLLLQLGLGGPGSYRSVNGVDASMAGQTGVLSASGAVLLPLGTSIVNRFGRTSTLNWVSRPDASQAQVTGSQRQFPDVAVRWAYRPAAVTGPVSNFDASTGYVRSDAVISLPSLAGDDPPVIRRSHSETFPVGASVAWAVHGGLSTGARYSFTRRIDSLPESVARSRGNELSLDAGRAFHIPESLGLGLRSDLRTRAAYQQTQNTTFVFDPSGSSSRLQDNGRQAFNLTGDTNVSDNTVLTFQGSRTITFDKNLNRRFEQTVFSIVFQMQFFGSSR